MQPRSYGILLVLIATMLWSTAGFFVRLLDLDVWTVLGWRSLFGGLALLAILVLRRRISAEEGHVQLWLYPLFGAVAAISMFGYIAALTFTSVANVLAIYATVPFVAAGIAFVWLKERMSRRALTASCIAMIGVLTVAGLESRPDDMIGNLLAFIMTASFSLLLVAARRYPSLRLAAVNAIGAGLCALIAFPLMSAPLPSLEQLAILAIFGASTSGIAYLLFMTGGRYIPSSEAGLIGLLDVVLGPLWVWLAFNERPSAATMAGAAIILMAVLWYLLAGRRRRDGRLIKTV